MGEEADPRTLRLGDGVALARSQRQPRPHRWLEPPKPEPVEFVELDGQFYLPAGWQ